MERKLSHRSERGTWAPFVGVALAALTIGSLVLFSVIAQRTAGGAFVSNGLAVRSPAQEAAGSIRLATGAGGGGSAAASERTATEVADPVSSPTPDLLTPAPVATPDVPLLATVDGSGTVSEPEPEPDTGERVASTDDLRPFFRMAAGGPNNGEVYAANRGKNANGEGKKSKASKDKHAKGSNDRARSHARDGGSSRGRAGGGSDHAAAPARRTQAAASSRPAPKPTPASSHPNQRGNGHSKSRGRGHRH